MLNGIQILHLSLSVTIIMVIVMYVMVFRSIPKRAARIQNPESRIQMMEDGPWMMNGPVETSPVAAKRGIPPDGHLARIRGRQN